MNLSTFKYLTIIGLCSTYLIGNYLLDQKNTSRVPASDNYDFKLIEVNQELEMPEDFCKPDTPFHTEEYYSKTQNWDDPDFLTPQNKMAHLTYNLNVEKIKQYHYLDFEAPFESKSYSWVQDGVEDQAEDGSITQYQARRNWKFHFPYQGNQIHLDVTDYPIREERKSGSTKIWTRYPSTDVENKKFFIFPRKIIPTFNLETEDKLIIYLPTGEEVWLNPQNRKILGGVIEEKIKANKGITGYGAYTKGLERRFHYPESSLHYTGKGVWFEFSITNRSNPLNPGNLIKISTGSPDAKCLNGKKCHECVIKSELLFERNFGQKDPNSLNSSWSCYRFKFKSDQDFNEHILKKYCEFEIQDI